MSYFRVFSIIRSDGSVFCLIVALFDYHSSHLLCEVEEQAATYNVALVTAATFKFGPLGWGGAKSSVYRTRIGIGLLHVLHG